jgi:hypothetical protein
LDAARQHGHQIRQFVETDDGGVGDDAHVDRRDGRQLVCPLTYACLGPSMLAQPPPSSLSPDMPS